jgi:hypothetical protein
MSLGYYVLVSIVFFCILYFSKEMRDNQIPVKIDEQYLESHVSSPRYMTNTPRDETEDTDKLINNKIALDEWIQSRLTQQGLKEMTESGHWQSEHSSSL